MIRTFKKILLVVLPLCGFWFMGQGAYIHTKAELAQLLLETAWTKTLNGQKEVKPWPWADTWPVARLSAPQLGISRIVLAGASGASLAFGPGHFFNSAAPGGNGNIIISGHRDTHFAFLQKLKLNDTLLLESTDKHVTVFRIKEFFVIDKRTTPYIPTDMSNKLMLITCYPFDAITAGGPYRFVVIAEPEPVVVT